MTEEIKKFKEQRKKFYTLRDLICGWDVIFTATKKKKRTRICTYFISHVKSVKLFHGSSVVVESSGPIYVDRGWEDSGPRVQLIKLKKEEIKVDLGSIDMDNITLTEGLVSDMKKYVLNKFEEVIKSDPTDYAAEEGEDGGDEENGIF